MIRNTLLMAILIAARLITAQETDSYQWLEAIDSERSLHWVEQQNDRTINLLTAQPDYQNTFQKNMKILNSTDRIATPSMVGPYIYNFWQDRQNKRGIWRRTLKEKYLAGDPDWETLLDLDALSETEGVKWVFKGASGLYPGYRRFLIQLSKGGGDAVIIKEFDVTTRSFVDDGFLLPEAKGEADWIDENTLLVSTDFGEGVTTSGYPLQVKTWKRGTKISDAPELLNGSTDDMGIWGQVIRDGDQTYQMIAKRTSFYEGSYYFIDNGRLVKLDLPSDIEFKTIFKGLVIFQLKSPWKINEKTFSTGALISAPYPELVAGKMAVELVFQPAERESITELSKTRDQLLINLLSEVKSGLSTFTYDHGWTREKIDVPPLGNISLGSCDRFSNEFFFSYENFLEPSTLYHADASRRTFTKIKSLPSWFPADDYRVEQFEAISSDGTQIPYFVVHHKSMTMDGRNPVLLYAYGGFEVSELPSYSATIGTSWLEKGGVYVLANLRGGGEFGPEWHQAGLKEHRQRVFDDFYAVAEDLIAKKITSPEKLGIYGGSNGGLLVGVAFTQRPELYKAVVCAVPLLDMKRYNKLLAGASWMAEYGNPDVPEAWEFIRKYSPYHNLKKEVRYPEVLFTTSTRDDRVHPGHARKMTAKMNDMGFKTFYFENMEGGHAGSSTNEQRAKMNTIIYTYLQMKLME